MRRLFTKLVAFISDLLGLNFKERLINNGKHILTGSGVLILILSFLIKGFTLELFGLLLLVVGLAWHYYSKSE